MFQRENGMWYVQFGRGDKRSLKTADRNKALKVFADLEREYLRGRLIRIDKSEMTLLQDFIEEYLGGRVDKSKSTLRADALALQKLLDKHGNKPMAWITGKKLSEFRAFLFNQKLASSSVNVHIRHLRGALKTALRRGYIKDKDCLEDFKTAKIDLGQKKWMTKEQLKTLLDTSQLPKFTDVMTVIPVMVYTGLSRIDAVNQIILTGDSIQYRRHKTQKLITVPIHPELRPYIVHLKPGIHRLVKFRHPDTLGHKFLQVVLESKIEGITPHKLRHTFATLLLEAGAELSVVSELLGHEDISITKKFYAHVVEGLKRKTMELLRINESN